MLDAPLAVAAERFRGRRAGLLASGTHHPQADVSDDEVEAAIRSALARLKTLTAGRANAIFINADQPIEELYAELITELRRREP